MSSGVQMVCPDNIFPSSDFIDIMNPGTFNGVIKMTLEQKTQPFSAIMAQAQDEFSNGFPMENFSQLLIGLYSMEGMKHSMKDGVLNPEDYNTNGHYIMVKLDINSAKAIFYDSYSDDVRKSPYFDYSVISQIIRDMYKYYTAKRNMPEKPFELFQQPMMHQSGSDCGCHMLINIELLLRRKDPAKQSFNTELIRKIRKYHFLLAHKFLHKFRLDI